MPRVVRSLRKTFGFASDAVRAAVLRANYYAGNYERAVWLIGAGRSGTTFLSRLLNWGDQYRVMFEPFHPVHVEQMAGMALHQYIRPTDANHPFASVASDVFTGKLTAPFVDSSNNRLTYKGLVIKDIFANLLAAWAYQQFRELNLRIVLLLRNPFAVALSTYKKRHWKWLTDPREFLTQPELMKDHLKPFTSLIENVGTDYIERQVLIWAILNHVPLKQFAADQLHVVFYEDILMRPQHELRRLFSFVDPSSTELAVNSCLHKSGGIAHPGGEVKRPHDRLASWQAEISPLQLELGTDILHGVGLDRLYDENGLPRSPRDPFSRSFRE
jgi:hypothetical protein